MTTWSVSAELFNLLLLAVLMLSFYEKRWTSSPSSRIYSFCLWLSAAGILLNLVCVGTLARPDVVPRWVNLVLNSGYFLLLVLLSTTIAYYLAYLVLEHVFDRQYLRRITAVLASLFGAYLLLILSNPFTGLVFSLDAQGLYHRGPAINSGYAVMGLQLATVLACAWRHRFTISTPMLHVIRILPPALVLLTAYQITFPFVLLNGTLIVVADLLLLLNFQSRRVEVDSLTWVNNNGSFFQELTLRLAGRQQFQVIVVSLRRFGLINQHFGHRNGDCLLVQAAAWLTGLHPQGQVFRLGNVEFAVLLPFTGVVAARKALDQVCRRFRQPWGVGAAQVTLDVHFAELIHTDQDWNASDALEFLRHSLRAAADREDHLVCFDTDTYLMLEKRRHIGQLLRRAIAEKRFQVWYQPLYNCAAGRFSCAEALLRLRDDDGEMVPPGLFVSIAEECGLLDEISWLLLEDVCALLGGGQAPGLDSVSINLSMQQFMSDSLLERVGGCLERYRVPPHRLKIEITERVLAQDLQRARRLMERFSEMGVDFYLDDFGTGYSNLSTVLDLPFSCIKLDHGLIRGLPGQERSRMIVRSMLQLFHNIGCQVVAEGVESADQAAALSAWGADWLQGYHFARPIPQEKLADFLRDQPRFLLPRPGAEEP